MAEPRVVPLSPAQRRAAALERASGVRLEAECAVRLEGPLDEAALRAALAEVVAASDALRLRLRPGLGNVAARLDPEHALPVWIGEPDARDSGALRAELTALPEGGHRLRLTAPVVSTDASGLVAVVEAAARAYQRGLPEGGAEVSGDAEPLRYEDFVAWQQEIFAAEESEPDRAYWQAQDPTAWLERALPEPADPDAGAPRFAAVPVALPSEVSARLAALAAAADLAPSDLVLAAWCLLLARHSGRPQAAVAIRFDGRIHESLERLPGPFALYLPLLSPVAVERPLTAVARSVRESVDEAGRHFEVFGWSLFAGRAIEIPPRLEAAFRLVEEPPSFIAGLKGELRFVVEEARDRSDLFAVELSSASAPGGLRLVLEHDLSLLPADLAARLAERLAALLSSFAAAPERPCGELDLLGESDLRDLQALNRTAMSLDASTLHGGFERRAADVPERVAVMAGGRHLTFAELERRSAGLARRLAALGAGPETVVAIAAERSLEAVVGLLGILRSGAAYLPLDPGLPPERLVGILEEARPLATLADAASLRRVPAGVKIRLVLGEEVTLAGGAAAEAPLPEPDPRSLAYVIYTSGSTGRPKGVAMAHGAIANRLAWMNAAAPLSAADRLLQKTPTVFDASIWEIFLPLSSGARLVLAEPEGHRDSAYLARAVAEEGITVLQLVPTVLAGFVGEPGLESCRSLWRLWAGGEALPADVAARAADRLPGATLHNLYGPTECAIDVTSWRWEPGDRRRISPIGRPIANLRAHFVGPRGEAVAPGIAGELRVGGAGLARGYFGRPDWTAERFVPDPFSSEPGGRLYRTGDLARLDADGEIEFLGRIDDQVKLSGLRIELGEIEAALRERPGLREAVAGLVEDGRGGHRLAVWFVADGDGETATDLRRALSERLPAAMVPTSFVRLASLPRLPSGKVDRKALPAPEREQAQGRIRLPETPVEELLAGIWADLLGRDRVGIDESFFDLGGHSLLAIQALSRVAEAFQVKPPLRALFQAPTVAAFAAEIAACRADARPLEPIRRVPRGGDLPVSFGQRRLWLLDRLDPGSAAYNLMLGFRLAGDLDLSAFQAALDGLIERHEALRTALPEEDGEPVARIAPAAPLPVERVDLSSSAPSDREAAARGRLADLAHRPFDLADGPLVRAMLIRLDEREHLVALALHHAVSDGWSSGILLRDFAALYAAAASGGAAELPELPIHYADYAAWQHAWLDGPEIEPRLAYWRSKLAGPPPALALPTDRPRPAVQSLHGLRRPYALATAGSVSSFARRHDATLFQAVLAGFFALLHRTTGQSDLTVGTPVAGRTRRELEGLVGFFVNTLALRVEARGGSTFADLLARVREASLAAAEHQDVPFEKLVEELAPERDLSRSPLFQAMFVLQNAPRPPAEIAGLAIAPLKVEGRTAKFDLTLDLVETRDGLHGSLEYATELFDPATVERLGDRLARLLSAAIERPEARLADLPLLSPEERWALVGEWNDTAVATPPSLVHRRFAAVAVERPDAPAVAAEGTVLSYGQLEVRARRLASYLRRVGVEPGVRVGLAIDRSPDLVAAVLGVLMAGGAYLPLDGSHPRERLVRMLEDARLGVLLVGEGATGLSGVLPGRPRVVRVEAEAAAIAAENAAGPRDLATPEDLAYVLFTSGSTGRPKGVEVTQGALANLLDAAAAVHRLAPGDRLLAVTPLTFDIAAVEILLPLLCGATVELVGAEEAADGLRLADRLARMRPQALQATPPTWRLLLEGGWTESPELLAISTGEALPPALAADLAGRVGELWNLYGPTETTIWSTGGRVRGAGASVSIGRPLAATAVHVLDAESGTVPIGVLGELHIGGSGLARGYLGRPDLTAERFVPDGQGGGSGERLYRTGDLAVRRPDGTIDCAGRIDHQVKIRGVRIELGEIETALVEHPGVQAAAVVASGAPTGDLRLVAYLQADGDEAPGGGELRTFLGRRLPSAMIPTVFVPLAALPLTPSGKVDRRALPAPEGARLGLSGAVVAPRDPIEEAVGRIWQEVLGVEPIGVEDDFFALGGHSLLATRVIARLRQTFRVEVPLRSFFGGSTVAETARLLAGSEPVPGQIERIARVFNRIEAMSAEEVRGYSLPEVGNRGASDGR